MRPSTSPSMNGLLRSRHRHFSHEDGRQESWRPSAWRPSCRAIASSIVKPTPCSTIQATIDGRTATPLLSRWARSCLQPPPRTSRSCETNAPVLLLRLRSRIGSATAAAPRCWTASPSRSCSQVRSPEGVPNCPVPVGVPIIDPFAVGWDHREIGYMEKALERGLCYRGSLRGDYGLGQLAYQPASALTTRR